MVWGGGVLQYYSRVPQLDVFGHYNEGAKLWSPHVSSNEPLKVLQSEYVKGLQLKSVMTFTHVQAPRLM